MLTHRTPALSGVLRVATRGGAPFRALLLLACVAVLAAAPRADVIVVDGLVTDLLEAVQAAADGDLLLLRPGVHGPFFNDTGKALTLVADGGPVEVSGIWIHNVPAGKRVVLRGLTVPASGASGAYQLFYGGALSLGDNAGTIVIEDCVLAGAAVAYTIGGQQFLADGNPGVRIADCAAVTLQRCTLTGGIGVSSSPGFPPLFPSQPSVTSGGPGAIVADSRVSFYECTVTGGIGGSDNWPSDTSTVDEGGNGGHGLEVRGTSHVVLSGNSLAGAAGADGCNDPAQFCCRCLGGSGLFAEAGAFVWDLDDSLAGAAGGELLLPGGGTAQQPDAPALDLQSGAVHAVFPGQSVDLHKVGPLRSGELGTLSIDGPPATLFVLFLSFEPNHVPLAHFQGAFHLGVPFEGPLVIGVLDGTGAFSAQYLAPDLGAFGLEQLVLFDQVITDQGADGLVLSSLGTHVQVATEF